MAMLYRLRSLSRLCLMHENKLPFLVDLHEAVGRRDRASAPSQNLPSQRALSFLFIPISVYRHSRPQDDDVERRSLSALTLSHHGWRRRLYPTLVASRISEHAAGPCRTVLWTRSLVARNPAHAKPPQTSQSAQFLTIDLVQRHAHLYPSEPSRMACEQARAIRSQRRLQTRHSPMMAPS